MGMSASQARFLSLTARKTNVEYEGQQINQQRTTLSNQSASYYSQLTNLTVPTPPSTQDYSRITYTFEDGTEVNTINQLIATKDEHTGKVIYMVNYTQQTLQDNVVSNGCVIVNKDSTVGQSADDPYKNYAIGGVAYTIGSTPLRQLADAQWFAGGDLTNNDYYLKDIPASQLKEIQEMEEIYLTKLREKYNNGKDDVDYLVRYQKDSETGKWTPVFYSKDQVVDAHYNDNTGNSLSSIRSYVWGQSTESNDVKNARATAEQDSSGRYKSITVYGYKTETYEVKDDNGNKIPKMVQDKDADGNPKFNADGEPIMIEAKDENGDTIYQTATREVIDFDKYQTFKLTATCTTDDDAYNDAMNKYNYDKSRYDKTIQDINSKIQIIQAQDKNLELKLKQLDTEQNAISTEMDAVKKVIQKNVESSFKTFNA